MPRRPPPSLNLPLPAGDALIKRALTSPANIDGHLPELLTINPSIFMSYQPEPSPTKVPCLASHLLYELYDYIRRGVTPELQWDGDPSRPPLYYQAALLYSTLLGRAYAITQEKLAEYPSKKSAPGTLCKHSEQLWWVMSYTFILAFFSGPDPEPGARYCAAILLLCAGNAMEKAAVKSKGKNVSPWYPGYADPEEKWDWWDLKRAAMETKELPKDQTDPAVLAKKYRLCGQKQWFEFVSREELDALEKAREKLGDMELRDATSGEVMEMFKGQLTAGWEPGRG
ncbi:MAG: hypothetical protein Q9227_000406 [Pyrenula ochraceoflavens]